MDSTIDLLPVVNSFKDFKYATEGGSSFRALVPAHIHEVHVWPWGNVRRNLRPAVWFDPLSYVVENF